MDGIIFSGPRLDDNALKLLAQVNFPTVLMGALPSKSFYSVDIDNVLAARTATEHLIKLGHTRIACITNTTPNYSAASDRLRGYQQALQKHDIVPDDRLVRYGNFDPQSGFRAMNGLLSLNSAPTAVFVASDVVAYGAMSAINKSGLQIPGDVAVIGFDDVPLSEFFQPRLSTIHLPIQKLAQAAGNLLIQLINGEVPENRQVLLDTHLVIRESCGAKS